MIAPTSKETDTMKTLLLAAAAALCPLAIAFPAGPAIAAEAKETATALHDHIRTTLHGSAGPVVVLIPGMSTPGAVWDAEVARLAPDHRVLVVEVRGFDGERDTVNESAGAIDGVVADIATDLKSRGLTDATIVGHSLGGLIAMKAGLAHPDLASRLLVVDALPFFGTVFSADATVETMAVQAGRMREMMTARAQMMRDMGAKGTTSGAGAAGMSVDEATRVKIANWSLKAEPLVVGEMVYEDTTSDLRRDIAGLTMPVTVLYQASGDNSAAATAIYTRDYAALKGARLVPVDNTAHFVMLDRPDAFAAELAALLAR